MTETNTTQDEIRSVHQDNPSACKQVLPLDDRTDPGGTRFFCWSPARWTCKSTGWAYCDEHAHVHTCCTMTGGVVEGEEA